MAMPPGGGKRPRRGDRPSAAFPSGHSRVESEGTASRPHSRPLPERTFDLVHARAVLTFLPRPGEALSKLVAALKPGGWLLIEEPDYVSAIPDPSMASGAKAASKKA